MIKSNIRIPCELHVRNFMAGTRLRNMIFFILILILFVAVILSFSFTLSQDRTILENAEEIKRLRNEIAKYQRDLNILRGRLVRVINPEDFL